jgi:hypothetical protein
MTTVTHPSFKEIAGPRVTALIGFLLEKYEVVEPGTGTVPTLDSILQDEGLQRMIINMGQELHKEDEEKKKKVIKNKSSEKKTAAKKPPATKEEKQAEGYDESKCSARKWESDGGLGYDNIQCSSCNKVPKEDAEKVLLEFESKMDESQKAKLSDYLDIYDGCFCKSHLKQDFFMPNGWWLGKVNEDRPEKPMLPKGSFKGGYQGDYKEHFWMYDSEGKKVEKSSKKKIVKKKKKTEEPEAKVDKAKVDKAKVDKPKKIIKKKKKVEEPKLEPEVVEEPKPEPEVEELKDEPEIVEELKDEPEIVEELKDEPEVEELKDEPEVEEDDDKTEPLSSDDENYEAEEYIVDGTEYMKVWDEDEKMWVIVDPESQEMVGFPDGNGGITPE